jgi:hypothetical protein
MAAEQTLASSSGTDPPIAPLTWAQGLRRSKGVLLARPRARKVRMVTGVSPSLRAQSACDCSSYAAPAPSCTGNGVD